MNTKTRVAIVPLLTIALASFAADPHHGGDGDRSHFDNRGGAFERSSHGSIRHEAPRVEIRREPAHVEIRHEAPRVEVRHGFEPRHDVFVHRDVDVDIHRRHFWNDFSFGRRFSVLPSGFITLHIGGVPYFYNQGVYFQSVGGSYQEVYPPIGAAIPQPPDGSIAINAGGQTYYYAGGAFYLQQPDGSFAIAPTPLGVVVPELPPGAVQVAVNGTIAYQFNGIYYEPVFVNGVTQYETFMPQ
jgi:hypothetical protein